MDKDALLQPIEGDTPIGVDPREDAAASQLYYELKDARSEARDAERQFGVADADDVMAQASPHWRVVRDKAPKLLELSKDLEVASWLVEATVRAEGFAGVVKGFDFLNSMVETFWDDGLYPQEDEDGIETRVAPLTALNGLEGPGTLIRPLKMIKFSDDVDPGPFAYWQYEQAVALGKTTDPEALQTKIDAGAVQMEDIQRGVNQSSQDAIKQRYDAATAALEGYRALGETIRGKVGDDAPPSSNIIETITEIQRAIRSLAPFVEEAPVEEEEEIAVEGEDGVVVVQKAAAAAGPIANREDALRKLDEVARYFEKNEPTSVVPLAIRDLIRRARMPISELLEELLHDEPSARSNFLARAGVKPVEPEV